MTSASPSYLLGSGLLGLLLAACLPSANDLGDTGTTSDAPPSTSDSGTTAGPPGDDSTTALDADTDPGPSTSTSTDTETDTDAEPPMGAFACVLDEPCPTSYFGCTSHTGCDDEPLPEWGPGAVCVLELARDLGSMPGASAEINFDRGGSPDWTWTELTFLLLADGTVVSQALLHDTKFGMDSLYGAQQCVLKDSAYFQGCLDVPEWGCGEPGSWFTDCVDLVDVECPGS